MIRTLTSVLVLAGLVTLLPAAPALAQKPTLDSRLDLRFEATPAPEVFRHIVSALGLELQLEASINDPVTIWVTRVSGRTALNVICEGLGCAWRVAGKSLVVAKKPDGVVRKVEKVMRLRAQKEDVAVIKKSAAVDLRSILARPLPVDMQFQDAPVTAVLRAISEVAGVEITADEPLASKRVTLTIKPRTVEGALKAVCDQAGAKVGFLTAGVSRNEADPSIRIIIRSAVVKAKK